MTEEAQLAERIWKEFAEPETLLPLCVRVTLEDERSVESLRRDGWREIETLEVWGRSPVVSAFDRCPVDYDEDEVVRIARATGGKTRLYVDPEVPDDVAERARILAAISGDNMICQEGGFLSWWEDDDSARIDMLAVDPERQGKGIGSNLLRVWMTMMVGKKWVFAGTQKTNRARELYRKHGFRVVERLVTFHKSLP